MLAHWSLLSPSALGSPRVSSMSKPERACWKRGDTWPTWGDPCNPSLTWLTTGRARESADRQLGRERAQPRPAEGRWSRGQPNLPNCRLVS